MKWTVYRNQYNNKWMVDDEASVGMLTKADAEFLARAANLLETLYNAGPTGIFERDPRAIPHLGSRTQLEEEQDDPGPSRLR